MAKKTSMSNKLFVLAIVALAAFGAYSFYMMYQEKFDTTANKVVVKVKQVKEVLTKEE